MQALDEANISEAQALQVIRDTVQPNITWALQNIQRSGYDSEGTRLQLQGILDFISTEPESSATVETRVEWAADRAERKKRLDKLLEAMRELFEECT